MKKLFVVFCMAAAPFMGVAHAGSAIADFGARDLSAGGIGPRADKDPPICICRSVPGVGQVCTPSGCGGLVEPVRFLDGAKPFNVDIFTQPAPVRTLPKRR